MPLTRLPLTTGVSGTLPIANGGTNVTTAADLANTGNMVLLSTTTPTATRDIDISLPSGYSNYMVIGTGIDFNTDSNEVDVYFTTDNFSTTDSAIRAERSYFRLDAGSQTLSGTVYSGYINISTNQGTNPTDSLDFEIMLSNLTTSSRTHGYSANGHSVYGHSGDTHHYRYEFGARSQTTSVVDGIRFRTNSGTAFIATGLIKIYGLR